MSVCSTIFTPNYGSQSFDCLLPKQMVTFRCLFVEFSNLVTQPSRSNLWKTFLINKACYLLLICAMPRENKTNATQQWHQAQVMKRFHRNTEFVHFQHACSKLQTRKPQTSPQILFWNVTGTINLIFCSKNSSIFAVSWKNEHKWMDFRIWYGYQIDSYL